MRTKLTVARVVNTAAIDTSICDMVMQQEAQTKLALAAVVDLVPQSENAT